LESETSSLVRDFAFAEGLPQKGLRNSAQSFNP
jgi:hypothetical protein